MNNLCKKKVRQAIGLGFGLVLLGPVTALGQTAATPVTTTDKVTSTIGNTASEASQLKGVFGSLMPSKKAKDTVFVFIANITYSDPNLKKLKNQLIKSKSTVKSELNDGIVILKVVGKSDAAAVYDDLDVDLQKMFVADKMENNRLLLEYKAQ